MWEKLLSLLSIGLTSSAVKTKEMLGKNNCFRHYLLMLLTYCRYIDFTKYVHCFQEFNHNICLLYESIAGMIMGAEREI